MAVQTATADKEMSVLCGGALKENGSKGFKKTFHCLSNSPSEVTSSTSRDGVSAPVDVDDAEKTP